MLTLYSLWGDANSKLKLKQRRPLGPLISESNGLLEAPSPELSEETMNVPYVRCTDQEAQDNLQKSYEKWVEKSASIITDEKDVRALGTYKYNIPEKKGAIIYPFQSLFQSLHTLSFENYRDGDDNQQWNSLLVFNTLQKSHICIKVERINTVDSGNYQNWNDFLTRLPKIRILLSNAQLKRKSNIPLELFVSSSEIENWDSEENWVDFGVSVRYYNYKKTIEQSNLMAFANAFENEDYSADLGYSAEAYNLNEHNIFFELMLERIEYLNKLYYVKTKTLLWKYFFAKRLRFEEIPDNTNSEQEIQMLILACQRELKHLSNSNTEGGNILLSYITRMPKMFREYAGFNKYYLIDPNGASLYNRSKVFFDGVNAPSVKDIERRAVLNLFKIAYAGMLCSYGAPFCIDLMDEALKTPWDDIETYNKVELLEMDENQKRKYSRYGKDLAYDADGNEKTKKEKQMKYEQERASSIDSLSVFVTPDKENLGKGYRVKRGFMNLNEGKLTTFEWLWNDISKLVFDRCSLPGLIAMMCGDVDMYNIESIQGKRGIFDYGSDFGNKFEFPGSKEYLKAVAEGKDKNFPMVQFETTFEENASQIERMERPYRQLIFKDTTVKTGCLAMLAKNLEDMLIPSQIQSNFSKSALVTSDDRLTKLRVGLLVWSLDHIPNSRLLQEQNSFSAGLTKCKSGKDLSNMMEKLKNGFSRSLFQSFDPLILRDSFDYGLDFVKGNEIAKYVNMIVPVTKEFGFFGQYDSTEPRNLKVIPGEISVVYKKDILDQLIKDVQKNKESWTKYLWDNSPFSEKYSKNLLQVYTALRKDMEDIQNEINITWVPGEAVTLSDCPAYVYDTVIKLANCNCAEIEFQEADKLAQFLQEIHSESYKRIFSKSRVLLASAKTVLPLLFMYVQNLPALLLFGGVNFAWDVTQQFRNAEERVTLLQAVVKLLSPVSQLPLVKVAKILSYTGVAMWGMIDVYTTIYMNEFNELTIARREHLLRTEKPNMFLNPATAARWFNLGHNMNVYKQSLTAQVIWRGTRFYDLASFLKKYTTPKGVQNIGLITAGAFALAVFYGKIKETTSKELLRYAFNYAQYVLVGGALSYVQKYKCCRDFAGVATLLQYWCTQKAPSYAVPFFGYLHAAQFLFTFSTDIIFSAFETTAHSNNLFQAVPGILTQFEDLKDRIINNSPALNSTELTLGIESLSENKPLDKNEAKKVAKDLFNNAFNTKLFSKFIDDNTITDKGKTRVAFQNFKTAFKKLHDNLQETLQFVNSTEFAEKSGLNQDRLNTLVNTVEKSSQCISAAKEKLDKNLEGLRTSLNSCTATGFLEETLHYRDHEAFCESIDKKGGVLVHNPSSFSTNQNGTKINDMVCKIMMVKANKRFEKEEENSIFRSPDAMVGYFKDYYFILLPAVYLSAVIAEKKLMLEKNFDGEKDNINPLQNAYYKRTEISCDARNKEESKCLVNMGNPSERGWKNYWRQNVSQRYLRKKEANEIFNESSLQNLDDYESKMDEKGVFVFEAGFREPFALSRFRGCDLKAFQEKSTRIIPKQDLPASTEDNMDEDKKDN